MGRGFSALLFAGIVLLAYKHEVDKFYSAVDWDLLAFFAGLFVVINMMEHAYVLEEMGQAVQAMLRLPSLRCMNIWRPRTYYMRFVCQRTKSCNSTLASVNAPDRAASQGPDRLVP